MRLDALLERSSPTAAGSSSNGTGPATGLDTMADWAGILSLGEQQRLAFARSALVLFCVAKHIVNTAPAIGLHASADAWHPIFLRG